MKKRITCLALCFAMLLSLSVFASAAETEATAAVQTPQTAAPDLETPVDQVGGDQIPADQVGGDQTPAVELADVPVADGMAAVLVNGTVADGFQATFFDGVTYVPLKDAVLALRPDAAAAPEDGQLVCRAADFTLSAKLGASYLKVNERYLYLPGGVKLSAEGETLVPSRALGKALGAKVEWADGVVFTTTGAPLASGGEFYDAQSVDLLARVITHESGNQPLAGKIAVGNVILNRVNSASFPNTIYEVVYQRSQFPSATTRDPNSESVLAAKLCLDGAMTAPGAYWFNGVGKPCWASRNKTLVASIGGHAFFG